MSSALGPREYLVEPERPPRSRRAHIVIGMLIVLAVGGGAFGIASAVSSPAPPPASTSTPHNLPGGGPAAGAPFGGVGARSSLRGTVRSVGSASFTIAARNGAITTIGVNASTVFRSLSGTNERLADLRSGDGVAVVEVPGSSPVVAASVTVVPSGSLGPGGGFGGGGFGAGAGANATFGTVSSVEHSSFVITLRTFRGSSGTAATPTTLTVVVTASTVFRQRPGGTSSLANLATGDSVIVTGARSGSTLRATTVAVLPRFRGGFGPPPVGSAANT